MARSRLKEIAAAAFVLAAAAPASAQWSDSAAPDAAGAAVARDYIVGAWTDSGDCAAAVDFAGDGTFVTAEGGDGLWALDGADLVLAGAGGVRTVRVIAVDRDTMEVIDEAGSRGRSTRCGQDIGGDADFVRVTIA